MAGVLKNLPGKPAEFQIVADYHHEHLSSSRQRQRDNEGASLNPPCREDTPQTSCQRPYRREAQMIDGESL